MDVLLILIDAIESLGPSDCYPTANLEIDMDPKQALEDAINALDSGDLQDARESLENYDAWRSCGGFEPTLKVKDESRDGDDVYHELRRIMARGSRRNAAAGKSF